MKRKILITLGAIFAVGILASATFAGVARATDLRTGDRPILASNETSDSTLYIAGNDILVAGTVRGDVFCAGANVNITGIVEGDVICAGQAVRVTGKVLGDIRVAGQSIELTGDVQGSATAMGESVIFTPESNVARDATVGGSRVHLEGTIGRDVLGGAESMQVSGKVGRSIDAEVLALTLDSTAQVGSDLNYRSESQAKIATGATIAGQTRFTEVENNKQDGAALRFWVAVYGFVAMLMIGLAALLFAPRALDGVGAAVRTRTVFAFASGAALLIVVPLVSLALLTSVFGIPLALILFMLWVAGLIASYVFAAYAIGWWAVEKFNWPKRGRRLASLVYGLLVMAVISIVPVVGPVVIFLLMLVGFGALAIAGYTRIKGVKAPVKPAKAKA